MKRRLPTIIESGFVLVAINLPPLTAEKNRHDPNTAQPGSPAPACQAAAIAASVHPSRCRTVLTAIPPSSTVNAANADPRRSARSRNRRHHPLAVV